MLTGVFHLHEQQARQVMTPAPAIVTVDVSENVETALRRCVSSGHTRLVVTEDDNHDRVKGIVHANALAQRLLTDGAEARIDDLVREAPIVPETKPLDDLLADLQRQRSSLAVVIDEYGRTAGIVTVEDIIEEVVGEIDDETDPLGGAVRRLANGDWFVRGHVAITDLVDYGLELPVDSDAYNSVGGFVFGELGRLPKRGDTITHNGYSIRVESVRENRIEAVRIRERRASRASEPDLAAAEVQRVAGAHLGLDDAAAVDPRPVRRAEVAQQPAAVLDPQLGVAARDGVVGEHELARARAADHQLRAAAGRRRAAGRGRASAAQARPQARSAAPAARPAGRLVRPRSSSWSELCSASSTRRANVSVPSRPARYPRRSAATVSSGCRATGARSGQTIPNVQVSNRNFARNCTNRLDALLCPATDWPLRRLRRREGDPGEDRPREHKSPAQGSEPGSSVSGGGVR